MGSLSPAAVLYDANGNPVTIVNDSGIYRVSHVGKLLDSGGSQVDPALKSYQESLVDSGNSSTAQLAASGVFTGAGVDCISYAAVTVLLHTDQDSAVDGFEFQWSMDNSNWDYIEARRVIVSVTDTVKFTVPIAARYFRLKYTNGDTVTTGFRVQTILHRSPVPFQDLKSGCTIDPRQSGIIVATETDEGVSKWLQSNSVGRLKAVIGEDPSQPVYVITTSGTRSYYHKRFIDADEPASITTGEDEPYDVGGETLTISINGSGQTADFATRAAQPGIHYSAPHPATSNPDTEKLKVSVDGGALLEVKIGKGWSTGADIAAQLQIQIRANVENGTNVTVEYDTTEYPFRYVFKSGTTGSSSIMHVEKGGDDFAANMYLGAFGGTERIGLDADNYWAFECIETLTEELTDVNVFAEGDGITIETVAGGASASLQVTAGGANTALDFPTTLVNGVAGSGAENLNVDGSSSSVRFSIVPPDDNVFVINHVVMFIRDNGASLNKFGGLAALTNGVRLQIKSANLPLIPEITFKTNADVMTQANEGELVDNGFESGGQDLVKATFDYSPGLRVQTGTPANIFVTVRDDLTDLDSYYVRAVGWVETS